MAAILTPSNTGTGVGNSRSPGNDDNDMAEAVEKLSEMLRKQDDPDVQDVELINRISEQISRMMDNGGEDNGDYSDLGDNSESEYDGSQQMTRQNQATTLLPHYPTPYELWKKAHEQEDFEYVAPVLSEKGWDDLVERLNDSAKEKQLALMRKQHQFIAEQLAGLNFSPHINRLSREMASENLKIYDKDRLEHVMKSKREKVEKARHQLAQEEIADCTFKPDLTAKAKKQSRSVEDLMDYGNVKRLRMRQRRQFMQDLEDREHTFQPQVNQNSMRMVSRMQKQGRLLPKGGKRGYKGTAQDPGHSEDTFSPKINKRSKAIQLKGNVYDRLYKSAKDKIEERNRSQEEYINDHIKGVMVSPLKGGYRKFGKMASKGKSSMNQLPEGAMNVVYYKHKYAFILDRFSNQVNM